MAKVLISLIIAFSLIIQRFESNVSNEKLNKKMLNYHFIVKNHFDLIVSSHYNTVSKKVMGKWLSFVFILLSIINYMSISIFGNDSENVLLKNRVIFILSVATPLSLYGFISSKWDLFIMITLVLLSGGLLGYSLFNENYNPYISQYTAIMKIFIIICVIIAIVILSLIFILYHFVFKMVSYIFYFILKNYFKLCLCLNPHKPLKPFVVITELLTIIFIPIVSLF